LPQNAKPPAAKLSGGSSGRVRQKRWTTPRKIAILTVPDCRRTPKEFGDRHQIARLREAKEWCFARQWVPVTELRSDIIEAKLVVRRLTIHRNQR
jgi:hypothetical protein